MVLLVVRRGADPDAPRFLCSALTGTDVNAVVEHIVAVHNLRLRLEASVAQCVGSKRPRDDGDAAFLAASEMLSPQSVRRKQVLSPQALHDAIAALQAGAAELAAPEEVAAATAELRFAGRTLQRDALLSFLMRLGFLEQGVDYAVDELSEAQRKVLADLVLLGLAAS